MSKSEFVGINVDKLEALEKERLNFGFDSIYFRYAELCEELALYKAKAERTDVMQERRNMNIRKMHFYRTLEQLLHAHEEESNDSHY